MNLLLSFCGKKNSLIAFAYKNSRKLATGSEEPFSKRYADMYQHHVKVESGSSNNAVVVNLACAQYLCIQRSQP